MEPRVDRPDMPAGYGPTEGLDATLPWSWAEERLVRSRSYWIATSAADGAPHVAPVWGVWVNDRLWFGTDPTSAKGRHLAREPRVAVNLESGDEVVIVYGRAAAVPVADLGAAQARTIDDAYAAKYVDPASGQAVHLIEGPPEGSVVYRVVPRRVLGWHEHDFLRSRTRWTFPDVEG
jgi:nitroimidazol reductase NimA-like FMN-containing flavoprotein (pyridoxamine 5'-phosphate oxidase superfamily)